MLDAITDFWKPVKKNPPQHKLKLSELQVGSTVMFGQVPQATLSNRKLKVSSINSYQFGTETLTSFVLSQESEADVSMIVADSGGEQYLAISRRISMSDRIKLFDTDAIEDIINKNDITRLACKDNVPELKGWLVPFYKREIQSMGGKIRKGAGNAAADDFKYTLLVSESNEHALEIEKYNDDRIDIYATVYRRTNDISEVVHPDAARLEMKLAEIANGAPAKPAPAPVISAPKVEEKKPEPVVAETKPEPVKLEAAALPEMKATPLAPALEKPKQEEKPLDEPQEKKDMMLVDTTTAKPANGLASGAFNQANNNEPKTQQEKPAVKNPITQDNDSIACELSVAKHVIEEAVRQEMRLSDVVRRIAGLPVAGQESVQIPVTLNDDDYALLAIRYGITASDRDAIKARIVEDINDFAGNKKPHVKAA